MEKLRTLVLESLTETQKQILERAREESRISMFVTKLRKELGRSDSTIWKSIRNLREKELLEKSEIVKLTELGNLLVMKDDK